ncbi:MULTISPECIES: GNAT family N-acetyltransferase [Enterococcus]|uniref:N-acetyltransferase domain-containing protein n=1 Tax=Enterococcus sulfureus ATCC 49903 TaxID=1140003 RepID=S0KSW3_9ENTE|nr:GNAT family N-acetyltransferase [Enterococcus sulfureus]EOT47742.1 hypothetical protein OMY_01116 [Enterococcus sulfureus ATCC 49903]EOT83837.1 hypothetical protein I573_01562 [Enterococcus sulfureus ATCC 49903]
MQVKWVVKKFSELTPQELYAIMVVRQEVFVVEQACVYQDADGWDPKALHLFCMDEQQHVLGYSRLFLAETKYQEASIGRVVVAKKARKTGLGRALLKEGLRYLIEEKKQKIFYIQAQHYLESFYASFGFQTTSTPYEEDDILHVDMIKTI